GVSRTAADSAGLADSTTFSLRVVAPFTHQYPTVVASDAETLDEFGTSVAISQGPGLPAQVLIGAPVAAGPDGDAAGAVYVFRPANNALEELAILTPADALEGDEFGTSLAADGDLLVVGVPAP